jgi:hypothetical protein
MNPDILLQRLLIVIKTAIELGDWNVDGRCDPELEIANAEKYLSSIGIPVKAVPESAQPA